MCTVEPTQVRLKNGRTVIIRSASPEDARGLASLARHVASELAYTVAEPDEAPTVEEMAERIQDRHAHPARLLLVAANTDGHIWGELDCGAGSRRRLAHRARFGISVARDHRDQGIGRALIQTMLDWASAHPVIEKVVLGVFAENEPAIGLYLRLGFVLEGRRVREFKLGPGRYADDLIMARMVKVPARVPVRVGVL
jgi:RimJ/RimL family protein N-acetyltransferase